jgi:hypothetical protein
MGYLTTSTRVASLTIGGVNYTNNLLSFTATDASANKNGLVSTSGELVLKGYGNTPSMEDYDRDNFKRGVEVVVNVTMPDGSVVRHPRGLLYVVSTVYNPDDDSLMVDLGCKLALAALTEDVSELLPLVPVPLDPAQQTYANISASFASAGKYLFQDNQGNLVSGFFFGTDSTAGTEAGAWTSVLGVTALAAAPMAGGSPVPDEIELSYQVPSDAITSDQTGKVDISETTSYYFVDYPATVYVRKSPYLGPYTPPTTKPKPVPKTSGCGNTPPVPGNGETVVSCSEGYETVQQATFVPATRIEKSISEYSAPGGQVSRVYEETKGPALEANNQYYADKFAYCRYTYANACQPNGECPMDGLEIIPLGYTEQINYYGPANELIKTIKDTWETRLAGAQPFDWRSGTVGGESFQFRELDTTSMYRSERQMVEYKYGSNETIQETTTWTSRTSRGSGIHSPYLIDALSGIKTFQRRISTTITANPVMPDTVNTVKTNTTESKTRIILYSGRYQEPPTQSGPYVIKESVPVPVLFTDKTQIDQVVNSYSNYLTRFVKGDAFGLSISETLRPEIVSNWRPGMPFRYSDPRKGKILALRMDATTWGVSSTESVVATNGIWCGISNGSLTIGSNLVGNSVPNLSGGAPVPPVAPSTPPSVGGETSVNAGALAWEVNIEIGIDLQKNFWGENGVFPAMPTDLDITVVPTLTVWCTGFVVQTGDLLATGPGGSIPIDYNGSLLTTGATVVDADLFS